jgi:vacuolar-type H+-ATPase subunit E/Vma4
LELTKEQIHKEYAEKKKLADARKAELEAEKAAAAELEKQQHDSKARLAAKAALFEKGA